MSEAGILLQRFLQGHPTVFGALLLMIGLLQSAFGIILSVSPCAFRDELGTHFSSAAVLILAGILTLAADKTKSLNLVKACLVLYIICSVVVAVVNIFYLIDLVYNPIRCNTSDNFCQLRHQIAACCTAMRGIVLVLTSLGFFVCISMAAFGCKAVCRPNTTTD
ncbi:membrane-spanning 4-domains subfamily A member 4A-like [Pantherophis guttatus]|uniref:Membrane-spanning 4-domains subfamily A member 4A-like n=1 Tax=Pantherophis guttatus TaxID=94885 RepID=A0A6P9CA49_PANGU|nr:membrane-spanning 4-domains subfamily A member 4A-like [Pantherophis guttatus]